MTGINRTNSKEADFQKLVQLLDVELAERDGDEHAFYAQYNRSDTIKHVVVFYAAQIPIACGAMKTYQELIMEIKRMYVLPKYRGQGISKKVLFALEKWASELNFKKCILETGIKQPEAIGLYKSSGYNIIPNYGPYVGVENSICFEKEL